MRVTVFFFFFGNVSMHKGSHEDRRTDGWTVKVYCRLLRDQNNELEL